MYYAICLVICNMQTKDRNGGREGGEYIRYIPRFTYSTFCPVSVITRLFWAQMALAMLVPFKGPKKFRFLGPSPLKCHSLWIVPPENHFVPPHINTRYINNYTGIVLLYSRRLQNACKGRDCACKGCDCACKGHEYPC
jgi:hypothetical protein